MKRTAFAKPINPKSCLPLILAVFLGIADSAVSATRTWDGGSGIGSDWSYSFNWTGNQGPQNGDDLVFPSGAARPVNTNDFTDRTFGSITFSGDGYTIRGNSITLTGGIDSTAAGTVNTLELDIDLGAPQDFDCNWSDAALYLNGDLNLGSNTLTTVGAGSVYLAGIVSGTGGITKNGSGTHWLSGSTANSYTGPTVVNFGALMLNKSGQNAIRYGSLTIGTGVLGADDVVVREAADYQIGTIPVIINSDGWLDVDDYDDTVGAITFNDGGHAGSSASGELRLGGAVTVDASTNEAILDGNVYMGAGTRTFDVGNGSVGYDLRVDAVLSGGGLTKTGSGLMRLAGSNTYTGATTLNDGNVHVANAAAFGATNSGTTVTGDGSIQLVSTSVGEEQLTLNKPETNGNALTASGTSGWAGDIVLEDDVGVSTGGTLDFSGAISGTGGITFNGYGDYYYTGSGYNTYEGDTVVNDGTLYLDKLPSGDRAISGPGDLYVGDGASPADSIIVQWLGNYQLHWSVDIIVIKGGKVDLNGYDDTVGGADLTSSGIWTGSGTMTTAGDISGAESTNGSVGIYGNLDLGSSTRTIYVADNTIMSIGSVGGNVSGTAGFQKTGNGELSLASSNTFSGVATVTDGSLVVAHAYAMGATLDGTVVNGLSYLGFNSNVHVESEPLTMNSTMSTALWITSGSNSWGGPITLSRETTAGFYTNTATLDLAGTISGPGGITKRSSGTLILSGSGNSYTGDTTVDDGTLELAAANVVRYGTLTVGSGTGGATTDIVRFSANNPIHSDTDIVINRDGLIDFNNYSDGLGHLLFDRGRITTGSGTLTMLDDLEVIESVDTNWTAYIAGHVNLNYSQMYTFDIDLATAFSMFAPTYGNGGITKTGAGQLFLSSSNSYDGLTDINDGTVYVDSDYSLGTTNSGTTVSSNAAVILRNDRIIENEELTLNSAGYTSFGTLASIYGSNTWSGPVTLAGASRLTTLQSDDYLVIDGPIDGSGDLTLEGDGTVVFSGSDANTFTGDTYLDEGTLILGKSIYNQTISGDLYIGDGSGGADADVVRLENAAQIPNSTRITIAASGLFDMNGINEYFGSLAGSGHVNMGSGILSPGHDSSSSVFSGLIEGSGELRKYGSGTFELLGNNTYTGDTTVFQGTLLVNGSQSGSDAIVDGSGTLGGIGTVGAIDSSGTVAPGASAGQLGSGNAMLQSGSTLGVELDGYLLVDYDQLDVNGLVTLSNADLSVSWGFVPAKGDAFTIIDNDGADAVVGTFNGVAEGGSVVASNVSMQITYAGGTGNDVVLAVTNVTPLESLALTSIGTATGSVDLVWTGGVPFFVVQKRTSLTTGSWQTVTALTRNMATNLPANTSNAFYRITGGN